uniref:Uncharacterized protein n=1 Tax=Mycena chlorophos TaxID=658473 RepID=A0ABQ0LEQ2_MYCCL|nr:predicted protein [Mycena chlorophos]
MSPPRMSDSTKATATATPTAGIQRTSTEVDAFALAGCKLEKSLSNPRCSAADAEAMILDAATQSHSHLRGFW